MIGDDKLLAPLSRQQRAQVAAKLIKKRRCGGKPLGALSPRSHPADRSRADAAIERRCRCLKKRARF